MRFQILPLFVAVFPFVSAVYIKTQQNLLSTVKEAGLGDPSTPLLLPNRVEERQSSSSSSSSSGTTSDPLTGLLNGIVAELGVLKKRQGLLSTVGTILTDTDTAIGGLKRDDEHR
ncbi:hypothetical protein OF83DRAFT_1168484 [Amylostereum chailletii]|nr:hypothetical protein OF83DRAFT_1168484 [Amylostereum chailletii]